MEEKTSLYKAIVDYNDLHNTEYFILFAKNSRSAKLEIASWVGEKNVDITIERLNTAAGPILIA